MQIACLQVVDATGRCRIGVGCAFARGVAAARLGPSIHSNERNRLSNRGGRYYTRAFSSSAPSSLHLFFGVLVHACVGIHALLFSGTHSSFD